MTHFALLCPTVNGHLNPMCSLGYELHRRGHCVTLVALPDAEAKAVAAGLEFCPIGTTTFPPGSMAHNIKKLGELSGTAALKYTIELLFRRSAEVLLREAPSALKHLGAELLLIDQVSLGGITVAEQLALPLVRVGCALMLNYDPLVPPPIMGWCYNPSWWGQLRNRVGYQFLAQLIKPTIKLLVEERQRLNLPTIDNSENILAQVCQQPKEFEFPRSSLPDCFHFTGPWANSASRAPTKFPFEKLTAQPLIYASLGTLQNRLFDTFEAIAQACQDLDAQLVIALGGGSNPEEFPVFSGSPLVVDYSPQLELLQRAMLTITHAGLNTTLESLSYGVPMVAIPIANDQPGVASRIAWTGTGEVVPLKQVTAENLRRAVTKVLMDESYRNRARSLQTAIQSSGGVYKAADIIEKAAQTEQPVLRDS